MRWFRKDRPPDAWEIADDRPFGDIGAAQRIREICASAGLIAERMAALRGRKAETQKAADAERYQAAIKCALEIAMKMSDDSMRDISVSLIVRLCVKVDHLKTARILLRAIQSDGTRRELMADSPALADQAAS